jgi:hypothetical protein
MALRFTQRQLDALREDAIKEGRSLELRERTQRICDDIFSREHVREEDVVWSSVSALSEGEHLVATDDGVSFYRAGTVANVFGPGDTGGTLVGDGERWVVIESMNGRGRSGSRMKIDQNVLIEVA